MNPAWYVLVVIVVLLLASLVVVRFGLERRWPTLARYVVRIPSAMVVLSVSLVRAPFRRTPPPG